MHLDEAAGGCGGRGGLYKYYGMGIQWPFRHFIASALPECRISLKEKTFRHGGILPPDAEEIMHPCKAGKAVALEHALASAAQRLRPNPDFTH
jgi:hypothetical protein